MRTVTRIFEFDASHRVMNERIKCFNLHGHRFKVEVTLSYGAKKPLGYAIDFKEIKRIVGEWIDEKLDHSYIANPQDENLIKLCRDNKWKLYVMGMGKDGDINPSAENLASELFYVIGHLFYNMDVTLSKVRLYETPNCWVETDSFDYVASKDFIMEIKQWREDKGVVNYDMREV